MPQEDYLRREIDKLGKMLQKALADLLGLKLKNKLSDGIEAANTVLRSELNISLDALSEIPENELLHYLYETKKLGNVHVELLADLLFEYAEQSISPNVTYKNALLLYEYVTETAIDYSVNRHFKIESIRGFLSSRDVTQSE